jgi:hypothetical protein
VLIEGNKLTWSQRKQVLANFIYRWTVDNVNRVRAWKVSVPDPKSWPRIPLISDEEWLGRYSFHFTATGQLSRRKTYAEPILPPPPAPILGSTKAGKYTLACLAE